MRTLLILSVLAACTSTDTPSHLPNPLLLPFAAISNGLSNTSYNAHRSKVSRFVIQNFSALKTELSAPSQPLLTQAMNIARVPASNRPSLIAELRSNPKIYSVNSPEPLIVALMVNST